MTKDNSDILKLKEWNESYKRKESYMFYPKEAVVKFINRFIKKRIGFNEFINIMSKEQIRYLDFGCGIGAQTRLLHEFGMDVYGIDISEVAIQEAKSICLKMGNGYEKLANKFMLYDGSRIPFDDNFFDVTICEGVLDSMYFELAKYYIKEIDRVTSSYLFLSLISGDDDERYREYAEDEVVKIAHEHGTIQSYYNYTKIMELIKETKFKIKQCYLTQEIGVNFKYKTGRYYIVLEKQS